MVKPLTVSPIAAVTGTPRNSCRAKLQRRLSREQSRKQRQEIIQQHQRQRHYRDDSLSESTTITATCSSSSSCDSHKAVTFGSIQVREYDRLLVISTAPWEDVDDIPNRLAIGWDYQELEPTTIMEQEDQDEEFAPSSPSLLQSFMGRQRSPTSLQSQRQRRRRNPFWGSVPYQQTNKSSFHALICDSVGYDRRGTKSTKPTTEQERIDILTCFGFTLLELEQAEQERKRSRSRAAPYPRTVPESSLRKTRSTGSF